MMFEKKSTEQKIFDLSFCKTVVWNISHTKKKWAM